MSFNDVTAATLEVVRLEKDEKAKHDGRYKEARLKFVNSLKQYIDYRIQIELENKRKELDSL